MRDARGVEGGCRCISSCLLPLLLPSSICRPLLHEGPPYVAEQQVFAVLAAYVVGTPTMCAWVKGEGRGY